MVCSLGVTLYGSRDSRQGVSCAKEVLNDLINVGIGRFVSLESASASMLLTPGIRVMDAWIFA